jgi:hypothetical protein
METDVDNLGLIGLPLDVFRLILDRVCRVLRYSPFFTKLPTVGKAGYAQIRPGVPRLS